MENFEHTPSTNPAVYEALTLLTWLFTLCLLLALSPAGLTAPPYRTWVLVRGDRLAAAPEAPASPDASKRNNITSVPLIWKPEYG